MSDITQDREQLETKAREAEQAGDPIVAGILRVAASDRKALERQPRYHRPNHGPYTPSNVLRCVNCGETLTEEQLRNGICSAT